MTSFGPFKVFHLKYSTTGHNFIGHYFALHLDIAKKNTWNPIEISC